MFASNYTENSLPKFVAEHSGWNLNLEIFFNINFLIDRTQDNKFWTDLFSNKLAAVHKHLGGRYHYFWWVLAGNVEITHSSMALGQK